MASRSPRTSPSSASARSTRSRPTCRPRWRSICELGRPLELPWLAGAVVDLGAAEGRADAMLPRRARHPGALCGREAGVALLLVPAKAGTQGQELDSRLCGNERERSAIIINTPLSAARASARTSATSSSLQSGRARSTLSVPMHWPSLTRGTLTQECSPRPNMIAWSSNNSRMPSSPALTSTRCSASTLRLQPVSRFGLRPPTG